MKMQSRVTWYHRITPHHPVVCYAGWHGRCFPASRAERDQEARQAAFGRRGPTGYRTPLSSLYGALGGSCPVLAGLPYDRPRLHRYLRLLIIFASRVAVWRGSGA